MRIISGTHGGRRFNPPTHMPHTRPTTDIAKEGLFNILQNSIDFEETKTLDLFGGTGSISYEFASRGSREQIIVEQDIKMHAFIKKNTVDFGFDHIQVVKMEVFKFIQSTKEQFDFIFAGPPYALKNIDDIPDLIFQFQLLQPNGLFVLEHTPRNNYEKHPHYKKMKNYGTTVFSFFENSSK
jgi:16S rRNA (guanine966-N2)-methyltransferase